MKKQPSQPSLDKIAGPNIVWRGSHPDRKPLRIVRINHSVNSTEHHYVLMKGFTLLGDPSPDAVGNGGRVLAAFIRYAEREWGVLSPTPAGGS